MKSIFSIALLIILLGAAGDALPLTPPLSPETLQGTADLVVEGEAQAPVQCLEQVESNKCSDIHRYEIPLKITKTLKGKVKAGDTIRVTFLHYDYSKSQCVGDQGPLILPGETGTFYLKEVSEGIFNSFHWSAVQAKRSGMGALPSCPKASAPKAN